MPNLHTSHLDLSTCKLRLEISRANQINKFLLLVFAYLVW